MKVKIEKLVFEEVEVDLPGECPGCEGKIGGAGNQTTLREHEVIGAMQLVTFSGDDVDLGENGAYVGDTGDVFITGYSCKCGHVLVTTER